MVVAWVPHRRPGGHRAPSPGVLFAILLVFSIAFVAGLILPRLDGASSNHIPMHVTIEPLQLPFAIANELMVKPEAYRALEAIESSPLPPVLLRETEAPPPSEMPLNSIADKLVEQVTPAAMELAVDIFTRALRRHAPPPPPPPPSPTAPVTAAPTRSPTRSPTPSPIMPTALPISWQPTRLPTYAPTVAKTCNDSRRHESLGHVNGPLIAVLHVPKSAGTTARSLFEEWATFSPPNNRVLVHMSNVQERCELGTDSAGRLSGIYIGHTGWGLGEGAPENRFNMILMREPKSRFLSFVTYLMQERRAPVQWSTQRFGQSLEEYRNARLTNPALLDTDLTTYSNRIIHHALLDQLSMLATYKCVSPTPDVNPFGCRRPHYVFDEKPGQPRSTALCSVHNMKRLALQNVRRADSIIIKDDLDDITYHARFHFDFIPQNPRPNRHLNAARRQFSHILSIGDRENAWLDEWLADERQVFREAVKLSRQQNALARKCLSLVAR